MYRFALALFCSLLVLASAQAAEPIFYASYNASIQPEKSAGSPTATFGDAGSPRFVTGIQDQAVVVGARSWITYTVGKNLNPAQGSISFLARPLGWNGNDGLFHAFLQTRSPTGDWLIIYKVPENKLQFTGGNAAGYSYAEGPAENWNDNQWKHICVTWKGDAGSLYVDGVLASTGKWPVIPKSFGEEFTIGGTIFGNTVAEQAIDELKMYDQPLSPEEIAGLHAEYKDAMEQANAAGADAKSKSTQASDDERTLLRVSFDGKIAVDRAKGSDKVESTGTINFTAGLHGKAVLLGRDASVSIPLAGNLNPLAGTMSFWIKPTGWAGGDGQWHYMVRLAGEDDWILLQTVNNNLVLLGGNRTNYSETTTPIADWADGQWKFVTVTWDNGTNRIYLDGRPTSEALAWPRVPAQLGTQIRLGGQLHGDSTGQMAVQDFEVRDVALPADQVESLYTSAVEKVPELKAAQAMLKQQQVIAPNNIATPAFGAIALPSSQSESLVLQVENAFDGDFAKAWLSAPDTFPNWVEMRWPQPISINKLLVNESPVHKTAKYRIDIYQDGKWTTLVPEKVNTNEPGQQIIETFTPTETARIRYIMLAPTGDAKAARSSITELQVCSTEQQPDLSKIATPSWKSHWIWYPEGPVSDVARYFRVHFNVDDVAAVQRAALQIGADDSYEVYLNGHHVGSGGIPTDRYSVEKFLTSGDNVLAIKCHQLGGFAGLICELALVQKDGTVTIVSDKAWKSLKEETGDWNQIAADESAWLPSLEQGIPPNCPDHMDQAYFDAGGLDRFSFAGVTISPTTAHPGESVEITTQIVAPKAIHHDYAFTTRIGERRASLASDFTVAGKTVLPELPTTQWEAGKTYTIKTKLVLPDWAPHGPIPLFVVPVGPDAESSLEKSDDGVIGSVTIQKFATDPIPWPSEPPTAEVRQINGHSKVFVNGKIVSPQILTENTYPTYQALGEQAKTGIHFWRIYAVRGKDSKFYPSDKKRELAELCAVYDRYIEALLKVDPNAHILLGTTFNVSQEWTDMYPDDAAILGDGRHVQHSFSSRRWIAEVQSDVEMLVKHFMSQPYSGHVVGLHFGIGGGPETYYWGLNANAYGTPRENVILGDFSPEHLRAFREWLRAKYADTAALQAAWKDQTVTFDNATPDQDILRREDLQMFKDPSKTKMPQDFWEFHSDVMAQRVIDIGSAIKKASGGKYLTGFWGLYSNGMNALSSNPGKMQQSAYAGLQKVLESPAIDYLSILQEYLNVRWGTPMVPDNLTESIRRHNKFCLIEYDMRTFFTPVQFTERTFSQPETLSVIRRDIAAAAVRGDAFWWVGFSQGTTGRLSVPWFAEESILEQFTAGRRIYDAAYQQDLSSVSEIAVFMNNADMYTLDVMTGNHLLSSAQFNTWANELTKIGAPFDQYHLNDISLPGMEKYKVYFFLNAFNINDAQKASIKKLLSVQGKTAVWLYAPGFSNGDTLSTQNIEDLTGFKVAFENRKANPEVEIDPSHRLTTGIEKGHRYKAKPYQHQAGAFEIGPIFDIVDPAAETMGKYVDNGKVAVASKKVGGNPSVYVAIPYVDAALARSICRSAGVHMYASNDVYLDTTRHLMTITSTDAGYKSIIKLPARSSVYDIFEKRMISQGRDSFEADIPPLSSALYYIGTEEETKQFVNSLNAEEQSK